MTSPRQRTLEQTATSTQAFALNNNDVAAIGDIVARFPEAPFAGEAKKRISELQREQLSRGPRLPGRLRNPRVVPSRRQARETSVVSDFE